MNVIMMSTWRQLACVHYLDWIRYDTMKRDVVDRRWVLEKGGRGLAVPPHPRCKISCRR